MNAHTWTEDDARDARLDRHFDRTYEAQLALAARYPADSAPDFTNVALPGMEGTR